MFPAAEDAHRGAYQCDYNYDFSPDVFSDPRTIFVTVKGKPEFINASCGKNLDIAFSILSEAALNVGIKSFSSYFSVAGREYQDKIYSQSALGGRPALISFWTFNFSWLYIAYD